MSLFDDLRMSQFSRRSLAGKHITYRVRWAPHEKRSGTISRVSDTTIWVGCFCFSHSDIVAMREQD